LTGYLARALSVSGYLGRHAAWFSVRQVVVALIFIAVLVALVAGPLLLDVLGNFFSKGVEKATPGGFVLGLVVLLTGLASGVRVIIIVGAALLGAVVLGVIIDKYLTRLAPAGHVLRGVPQRQPGLARREDLRQRGQPARIPRAPQNSQPELRIAARKSQRPRWRRPINAEGGVA
jgi:hypothetical protein